MPNTVQLIKRAAIEAVDAGKPVHLLFGQVVSASPLKIQADQKTIYTGKMLVLTRNVTDFQVDVTVSYETEKTGRQWQPTLEPHTHSCKGRKQLKIHNALAAGDWVVLARIQGGKKLVVLDRIKENPATKGEWL